MRISTNLQKNIARFFARRFKGHPMTAIAMSSRELWTPDRELVLQANPTICHVASSKDETKAIEQLGQGLQFNKDTWRDNKAYEEMIVAKSRLLKDYPFWGVMGMMLTLVEFPLFPTLATDGRHLFYNAEFVMKLQRGERMFAVAHEIMHCLYVQCGIGSRGFTYTGVRYTDLIPLDKREDKVTDKDKENHHLAQEKLTHWNYAADFIVNDDIVLAKIGDKIKTIPILHDEKFRGWAAEDVYDFLRNNPEEAEACGASGGTLDTHIDVEVVSDDEFEEEKKKQAKGGEGKDGKGQGIKIRIKRSDAEKMKDQWQNTMFSAAAAQKEHDQRTQSAGTLPAGIQRLIDELVNPRVNWRAALRRFIISTIKRGYSYMRPNKALFSAGWTLPSFRTRAPMLKISIAVDTSGSVGRDQLTAFISEIRGIMKVFPAYELSAWCFDGDVIKDSFVTLTKKSSGNDWTNINKFAERVSGGGGTVFEANWRFMRERRMKPKLLIVCTDGYPSGNIWGEPLYCPTMFMMMGNDQRIRAPFGMTIHYEEAA